MKQESFRSKLLTSTSLSSCNLDLQETAGEERSDTFEVLAEDIFDVSGYDFADFLIQHQCRFVLGNP